MRVRPTKGTAQIEKKSKKIITTNKQNTASVRPLAEPVW